MNAIRIKLTDELLQHVVGAVAERTGNVVGPKQINMIESRLSKRALELGLKSENEYLEHFQKSRALEIEYLVSVLTVHHSFFFREFSQFEFLAHQVLPSLVARVKREGRNKVRIWSAACSRGQEAYSLFMFIDSYFKDHGHKIEIEILGTDVDLESVKIAANGVFAWDEVKEIPMDYLSTYWVRGTGEIEKFAKIRDRVRSACTFRQSNLMETSKFGIHGAFDIIFCRNVFIYFQADDIARISEALCAQIRPDGYFFVGLSESLPNAPARLKKRGPSIYGPPAPEIAPTTATANGMAASVDSKIRVICVDDSKTILTIMKSVLKPEHGFEVVATAMDGFEAMKLVQGGIKFDIMTLDIHMPNMTGIEYLEKNFSTTHPPVVMLTSASRDNMDLAHRAVKLGARDYIEKPSLNDLAAKSDEIRAKLRRLCQGSKLSSAAKSNPVSFEKQFQTSLAVKRTNDKVNVIFSAEARCEELLSLLKDTTFMQVPCIVVALGEPTRAQKIKERIEADIKVKSKVIPLGDHLTEGKIYFLEIGSFRQRTSTLVSGKTICYSVLSNISRSQWETCPKPVQMKILLAEDVDRSVFLSQTPSIYVSPVTSFAYMANEFFGKTDQKKAA